MIKELRDAFINLPVNFVIEMDNIDTEKLGKNIVATSKIPESFIIGFDFMICDKEASSLKKYLEKWVTPIISKNNPLKSILKEFDPAKNIWNSFLFESENKWQIFSKKYFKYLRYRLKIDILKIILKNILTKLKKRLKS